MYIYIFVSIMRHYSVKKDRDGGFREYLTTQEAIKEFKDSMLIVAENDLEAVKKCMRKCGFRILYKDDIDLFTKHMIKLDKIEGYKVTLEEMERK